MTYKELKQALEELSAEQLNMDVTIVIGDECYGNVQPYLVSEMYNYEEISDKFDSDNHPVIAIG